MPSARFNASRFNEARFNESTSAVVLLFPSALYSFRAKARRYSFSAQPGSLPLYASPKDPDETVTLKMNFSPEMDDDEAISAQRCEVEVTRGGRGSDDSPEDMRSGSASLSGTTVSQKLTGGVDDTYYKIRFEADTDAGHTYIATAILPVKSGAIVHQAPAKDPEEILTAEVIYSNLFTSGETIEDETVTVAVLRGSDASPNAMKVGIAQSSDTEVLQMLDDGEDGTTYAVRMKAETSAGHTFVETIVLPVRTA